MSTEFLANPPSNFSVDKALADELLKLNFKDRNELEEEVHGVRSGAVEETPELLERSLAEFDAELNTRKEADPSLDFLRNVIRISSLDETAADTAKTQCYLNDPDIRLRFLRCECFDVKKAVTRIVNFLEFMTILWGDFPADRPVRLSDFNSKEETALLNSRCQYLPFRDRSGRRVLVSVGGCNYDMDPTLRFKIFMYMHWIVSEDVETQRKGSVSIAWIFNEDDKKSLIQLAPKFPKELKLYSNMHFLSMPIRQCSFQMYFLEDTIFYRLLAAKYVFNLNPEHRKNFKYHFGTQTELEYKLAGFGIPTDLLPISCTGKVKTANQSSFVNVQRAKLFKQNNGGCDDIVECPKSEDVVFKKGPGYRNNPGNLYFRDLIELAGEDHKKADKEEKFEITLRIVEKIEAIGGRFLEWSKQRKMWIVNKDLKKVRSKVASCIKQYNRQRLESQQLNSAIADAAEVAPAESSQNGELGSVKHDLFQQSSRDAKRQKIVDFCQNPSSPEDMFGDAENACFGMRFFPTNEQPTH